MDKETSDRRKKATMNFMLKIAEHKIATHGLKDTPEEYVKKAQDETS